MWSRNCKASRSIPGFLWCSCYSIFSFVYYFVDHYLFFCTFSFGHCIVCSSSIYDLWLPLWYLWFTASYYHFGIFNPILCQFKVLCIRLWSQGFLKECFHLIFQNILSKIIKTLSKCTMSLVCVHIWRKVVLAIISGIKVDWNVDI